MVWASKEGASNIRALYGPVPPSSTILDFTDTGDTGPEAQPAIMAKEARSEMNDFIGQLIGITPQDNNLCAYSQYFIPTRLRRTRIYHSRQLPYRLHSGSHAAFPDTGQKTHHCIPPYASDMRIHGNASRLSCKDRRLRKEWTGSPLPPCFTATMISLAILVKAALRLASAAPLVF